jgi:hypothetical protein
MPALTRHLSYHLRIDAMPSSRSLAVIGYRLVAVVIFAAVHFGREWQILLQKSEIERFGAAEAIY